VGLYPIEMFELSDGHISSRWSAAMLAEGLLELGPPSWLRDDFWDDDSDGASKEAEYPFDDPGAPVRDGFVAEMHALEDEASGSCLRVSTRH
jgi:hypothetical protein